VADLPRYPASPASIPVPGLAARRAALKLLDAVLRRGQPLETALHAATQGMPKSEDRALAHAIAAETLRHLPDLDALINGATAKPLPDDAKARMVLRIALTQVLSLGTPAHAAIATVLPLVDGGPKRLVHGVFGTLSRAGATLPNPPTLPPVVAERWNADWQEAARVALAAPPPLDLTIRDAAETAAWAEKLGGESLMPGHVRLRDHAPVTALPGFSDGAWWVQDLAASLPARLLGAGAGTALDLCAAPGGKALQLAAAGWHVLALDRSAKRLERMAQNADRTGLSLDIVTADALEWTPDAPAPAILLDAPCTATGIFRRHPDVLHRVGPREIAEMVELQSRLLDRSVGWLTPGGRLVYATCSLEPEEGEQRIEAVLADHPEIAIDAVGADELPAGVTPHERGWVRTLPGMLAEQGGLDGFFIARLVRA
jgi:16S rRNA (cytosine967-C5)-methyltransferase